MSVSMSSVSLPVCIKMLENLSHLLDKAPAFVELKPCDPQAFTQFRLAPDMLPFSRQILIACDAANNGLARLSGLESPKFDDTEVTLEELKAVKTRPSHFRWDGTTRAPWPVGCI